MQGSTSSVPRCPGCCVCGLAVLLSFSYNNHTKMCPQARYLSLVVLADRVARAAHALREERDLCGFEVCFRCATEPLFVFQNAVLRRAL